MHIRLESSGKMLGNANWDAVPLKDSIIGLKSATGQMELRRVDEIEENRSDGSKIVRLSGAIPFLVYSTL